jgi:5-methylthioadenosine/S-adenosylhomocysteine deaminase
MTEKVDTLIIPGWLIPVVPENQVLQNHAIALRDGVISHLLPTAEATSLDAAETLHLPEHALLPGLINGHGHAAMSLLRGYADDYPLMPWLEQHIWPAEGRHVGEEYVRDGVSLAMAEMIRSGTTCFSDMYFFPNITAELCQQVGMRCQITFPIFDFPSAWGIDADDYISKGLALRDDYKHSELLNIVFGPHATYTLATAALAKIGMLAAELDLPIHIHLHETADEVAEALQATGVRPLQTLNELGLLGPRTQCVHMTELDAQDIELLAATGAHVIHCPESNMKLGSGICPVVSLQQAGINVALGTDGAASNNDLDLFGEMRSAALLAKLATRDATSLPAAQALSMATICGARAMGMEDRIGSLETGKLADLIAVDLSDCNSQPVYNPISQLVYAASSRQVSHSWVAGKALLENGELTQLDSEYIARRTRQWGERISTET